MPARYSSRYRKPGLSNAYPQKRPRKLLWRCTAAAGFLILLFLFFDTSPVPAAKDAAQHIRPFGPSVHTPPTQRNHTGGEARWHNNWQWLNPFSDAITADDSRSVLPPTIERPPIYAFYDTDAAKDEETKNAENKLLLAWRRAWWAQGFKPVILGKAEALQNPLYERFQVRKLDNELGAEFMRWLAWGQMGTGILANWLVLPMGPYDDPLLSYLRRGEYPKLTRYEGLGGGLFSGDKASIGGALSEALDSKELKGSHSFLEQVSSNAFLVDPTPKSVAFYEASTVAEKYKSVSALLSSDKAAGLRSLAQLIVSHLHLTFLNSFTSGFAILTPHRAHSLVLSHPAINLANSLIHCPRSPAPDSCPPNNPQCTPCSSSAGSAVSLKTAESYTNSSSLFTIGTVPHPYTLTSLLAKSKEITVRHIRRDTARDRWLAAATRKILGAEIGGPDRIVSFKEAVASERRAARGLWLTAEESEGLERRELEWHFGFELAAYNQTDYGTLSAQGVARITTELADPRLVAGEGGQQSSLGEKEVKHQIELVAHAKSVLGLGRKKKKKKKKKDKAEGVQAAVEAWNLADTEAWRFARAFGARGREERMLWEEEEKKFAGGDAREGRGEGWGRWFDR
ncbi:MAG: hypothetical protein Q9167_005125 [Letrouitia subvulpina]